MLDYFRVDSILSMTVFKEGYYHKDVNGSIDNLDEITYKIELNKDDIIGVEYVRFNHWNGTTTRYLKLRSINLEPFNRDTGQSTYFMDKFTKLEIKEIRNKLIEKITE